MKLLHFVFLTFLIYSCNNEKTKSEESVKIDSLTKKVDELTEKNNEFQKEKTEAEAKAKENELNKKKELILNQIRNGQGIIISVRHDPVGMGGINNGTVTIENALDGIVFKIISVETTIYLSNGAIYKKDKQTFTNFKPGDTRTRNIPNTGTRGSECKARVTEIQSTWLTDGKIVEL